MRERSIAVGDLVAFILYLFLLVMPLGRLISAWTQVQTGLGALARVQEVLALEPERDDVPEVGGGRTVPRVPGRVSRPGGRAPGRTAPGIRLTAAAGEGLVVKRPLRTSGGTVQGTGARRPSSERSQGP